VAITAIVVMGGPVRRCAMLDFRCETIVHVAVFGGLFDSATMRGGTTRRKARHRPANLWSSLSFLWCSM
jgi:hypothetical protein